MDQKPRKDAAEPLFDLAGFASAVSPRPPTRSQVASDRIAVALRTARKRAGLSQAELSLRAGLGQNAVFSIERRGVVPRADTLQAIADALGLAPGDLFATVAVDAPADRPTWDSYFINIAKAAAHRSTCARRSVGAIIVRDRHILATGYNGAPAGVRHCDHVAGADMRDGHCARSTHAEQNAIAQAARHGVPVEGSTVYCTDSPCAACAKILINAGVVRAVYAQAYPDDLAAELFGEAGVAVEASPALTA